MLFSQPGSCSSWLRVALGAERWLCSNTLTVEIAGCWFQAVDGARVEVWQRVCIKSAGAQERFLHTVADSANLLSSCKPCTMEAQDA